MLCIYISSLPSQLCTARADLSNDPLQMKPEIKKVKVTPGEGLAPKKYFCEKEFCTISNLADHKRGAQGADKLNCRDSNCTATFASSSALRRHMWVKHDIGKGPKCDLCGKKEPSISYLRNHQRAAHGAPKLQCKEPGCTKTFTYNTGLYTHMQKEHN